MPDQKPRRNFLRNAGIAALSFPAILTLTSQVKKEKELIKPKPLKKGDTIGVVAPASYIRNKERAEKFFKDFEEKGYKIKPGKNIFSGHGYYAGTDKERLDDLHEMFNDPKVDVIFALGGGWGSGRLLPNIDFDLIRNNPKVLLGYSDITALHLGIHAQTNLVTFHGPNGTSDWNEFSTKNFETVLINNKKAKWEGSLKDANDLEKGRFTITKGKTTGRLVGGNLTVMSSLVGSPYIPDMEGTILFLEDIGEDVYRIDRFLTHLKLAGILENVNGIVFGSCNDCEPERPEHSFSLKEMLELNLKPLKKPCFFGSPFGHLTDKYTFPLGVEVEMDAEKGTIYMKEKACS